MEPQIMVLGVGNILYSDDGFGIKVVEQLQNDYVFPDHVTIVDGGVLGVNLLGVISHAHKLIVVDTILNRSNPGDFHRLEGEEIPNRILGKNSMHQVDLLEALTLCRLMDNIPETIILGVEPQNIETLNPELTPVLAGKVDAMVERVLQELLTLGVPIPDKIN
jgi:hydrogenase maturation protease